MAKSIKERVEALLDQLENPNLNSDEIRLIQEKIDYLRTLTE